MHGMMEMPAEQSQKLRGKISYCLLNFVKLLLSQWLLSKHFVVSECLQGAVKIQQAFASFWPLLQLAELKNLHTACKHHIEESRTLCGVDTGAVY